MSFSKEYFPIIINNLINFGDLMKTLKQLENEKLTKLEQLILLGGGSKMRRRNEDHVGAYIEKSVKHDLVLDIIE